MSTCKKKSSNPEEKKRTGAPRDGRKVKTNDLVSGVLVIVRLEGQHWLGLVLAQPESLRVQREVREGMWMKLIVRMLMMRMMIVRMLTMRMKVFMPTIK